MAMDPKGSPGPDDLLANAGLVRATARAILGGDPEVEDVVQETWLRALRSAPARPRSLGAWLSRVARNRALDVLRRRNRDRAFARSVRTREGHRSVEEIAEREETRRRVVTEMLALEEPCRTALLLRYDGGLPVKEIATRLGVPFETVRTRLRRGLARLRARLDAGPDERPASLALVPLALLPPEGAVTATVLGALAMKKLAAVVLLLLAVLGVAVLTLDPLGRRKEEGSPEAQATVAGAEPTAAPEEAAAPTLRGATEARPDGASPEDLPFAAGLVVDTDGKPIPGVAVISRGREDLGGGRGTQEQGFEFHQVLAAPTAWTDAEGRFRVEEALPEQVSLVFVKDGYVWAERRDLDPDAAKNQALRVTLEPGRRVVLLVEDTDGAPVEHARILLWCAPNEAGHVVFGAHTTDARGRCVLGWLRPTDRPLDMLVVGGLGYESQTVRDPVLDDEQRYVLRRKQPIFTARDAATGARLADAAGLLYRVPGGELVSALLSDPGGDERFAAAPGDLVAHYWRARPFDGPQTLRAVVFAPGHLPTEAECRVVPDAEPPRVEVRLRAGQPEVSLSGRVRPPDARLDLCSPMPVGWGGAGDPDLPHLLRIGTRPDGAFSVAGLPSGGFRLVASGPGLAPAGLDVDLPVLDVTLVLEVEARLEVRVVSPEGQGVPGHAVSVLLEGAAPSWHARTDADGVARFDGLPAGTARVTPDPGRPVILTAGETARVEAVLSASRPVARRVVALRVVDEEGEPVPEVRLSLRPRGGRAAQEGEFDRLRAWSATTDASGRADASVYVGTYEVMAERGAARRRFRVEVDAATRVLDLVWLTGSASLFGRVTEEGTGAPIPNRLVIAWLDDPDAHQRVGQGVTDQDGRYEVPDLPLRALRVHFVLNGLPPDGVFDRTSPYPTATLETTLEPGERRECDVRVPRVRGADLPEPPVEVRIVVKDAASGEPLQGAVVVLQAERDGLWVTAGDLATDADGRATGRVMRGERYRLYTMHREGRTFTHERAEQVVAPAGDRLAVEIALEPLAR